MHNDIVASFYSSWLWLAVASAAVLAVLTVWGHAFLRVFRMLQISTGGSALRSEELLYGSVGFSVLGFLGVVSGVRLDLTFAVGSALAVLACVALRRPQALAPTPRTGGACIDRGVEWLAPLLIVAGC